jgi:hypothetical protein
LGTGGVRRENLAEQQLGAVSDKAIDDVMAGQRDLISRRVRSAIRDEMSGTNLRGCRARRMLGFWDEKLGLRKSS